MASKEDLLFGKVAVSNKLLDRGQLEECLEELKEKPDEGLPSIVLARGYMKMPQVQKVLAHVSKKLLGGEEEEEEADERRPAALPSGGTKAPSSGAVKGAATTSVIGRPMAKPAGKISGDAVKKLVGGTLKDYLTFAKKLGASDLHITAGGVPFLRLHGRIRQLDHPAHSPEDSKRILLDVLTETQRETLIERNDLDFAHEDPDLGRFRSNYFHHRRGFSGVFRIIPDHVPTLEELGLPKTLEQFTAIQQGIVLVTGPAGSGKSSTMAALVELVNQTRKDHVITVEDPIEFVFESKKSNVSQRQVMKHTDGWGIALRAALREDPDVIMVGEMRDLDTVATAVTAAETGHLVIGTLHTTNATRTVDRIIDIFPPRQQEQIRAMVSESIRGVICQQLVPRADGKGVVPALEILVATPAVANLIREKRTFQLLSVLQTGKHQGMVMMDDSIQKLLQAGVITRDEAIFRANDPRRFTGAAAAKVPVAAGAEE